jgi:hypothetical protein
MLEARLFVGTLNIINPLIKSLFLNKLINLVANIKKKMLTCVIRE